MPTFNHQLHNSLENSYAQGYLPQRNLSGFFYLSTSCRSNLKKSTLSSENKRILNTTASYTFKKIALKDFSYTIDIQKKIYGWIKELGWDFPIASVKTIFTNHIFNYLYVWSDQQQVIGYAICLFTSEISHIAYVFYNPEYARRNLPIRMVLEVIIDSQSNGLDFCYLGQFTPNIGYYKRNMPGFEYFHNNQWATYNKNI